MIGRSRRKALVFAAIVAWIATVVAYLQTQRQTWLDAKIVTWPELRNAAHPETLDEIGRLRWDLRRTVLDEVTFENLPFSECLAQLERTIADELPHIEPVAFRIEEAVSPTAPTTLRLRQIPVLDLLRYLGGLHLAKPDLESGRTVVFDIAPLNEERFREEGWFRVPPSAFRDMDLSAETVGVLEPLRRLGVNLETGEIALYYPRRGLLWASADVARMEAIDTAVSGMIICHTPTWKDWIMEQWHRWTARPRPAPTAPPISSPPVPDPFDHLTPPIHRLGTQR